MSVVRLIRPGDNEALSELLQRNRDFLAPWTPERPPTYFTAAGQRLEIEGALSRHQHGESLPLVIQTPAGDVVGRVTLTNIVRGAFQSCSLSYWLGQGHTGQGIATAAVNAAVRLAFTHLELHRVQAETLVSNAPSCRVLARTGFVQYGIAAQYLKIAGRWQDHLLFQRIRPDGQGGSDAEFQGKERCEDR